MQKFLVAQKVSLHRESTIYILEENKESRAPTALSVANSTENRQKTTFGNGSHYSNHYHHDSAPHLPFRYKTSRKNDVVIWAINRMEADEIFQGLLTEAGVKV